MKADNATNIAVGTKSPEVVSFRSETREARGNGLRVMMVSPQPFFRARGTPFSVLHRIRGILAAGHSVDLLTYPFGRDLPMDGLEIERCARPPFVRDVRVGPSMAKLALDIGLYLRVKQRLSVGVYDVLHSHEEAAFFGVALARRHGLVHVYDMHSSLPQQLSNFSSYNWAPFRILFSRLEQYVLRSADGVITVCPDLASFVESLGLRASQVMIENTADDRKVFGSNKGDFREQWGIVDKKVVLYTGTLEHYQGIDLLISALPALRPQVPNVHVLVVGGRPEQIEHYRTMAARCGVTDIVTFTGTQPPSDMPAFAEAADVIVSPRCKGSNSPGKLYGYMRARRPIVATDHKTHTQVLDATVAELVPVSPRGILDGLLRVLRDQEYARSLADAAYQRAEEQYSDELYIKRVGDFYSTVAKLNARGTARDTAARRA